MYTYNFNQSPEGHWEGVYWELQIYFSESCGTIVFQCAKPGQGEKPETCSVCVNLFSTQYNIGSTVRTLSPQKTVFLAFSHISFITLSMLSHIEIVFQVEIKTIKRISPKAT